MGTFRGCFNFADFEYNFASEISGSQSITSTFTEYLFITSAL